MLGVDGREKMLRWSTSGRSIASSNEAHRHHLLGVGIGLAETIISIAIAVMITLHSSDPSLPSFDAA